MKGIKHKEICNILSSFPLIFDVFFLQLHRIGIFASTEKIRPLRKFGRDGVLAYDAMSILYIISITIHTSHHPEFNPEAKETSFWIHRILVRRV
jgi:hypothetical protein